MSVDLKNHPRLVELADAAAALLRGPRSWIEDTPEILANVSSWLFATDELLPLSAVWPEVRGHGRGRELRDSSHAAYVYGLSSDGAVLMSSLVLGPNSRLTQYVTRDGARTRAVTYQESAVADPTARVQSVWLQEVLPLTTTTLEVGMSAYGESRALVVRTDSRLTVSETCRDWDNMNIVATSIVLLDDDGLPRLVTSSDGRVTYQRVVKLPKDLETKATKVLIGEISSVIKRENKVDPTAGIVVVHGQGPELFPPHLYVVPSRLLPTVKDDTWLEPNRLETAGLEPT